MASLSGIFTTSLALGVTVTALYLASLAVYNLYLHPLCHFPGPKLLAATNIPFTLKLLQGNLDAYLKTLHDKYGPVIRTGPNRLSFNDAAAWNEIYGHRQTRPNMNKDPQFYNKAPSGADSILTAGDFDHWRMRRYLSHAFSTKALEEQQYIVKEHIDLLIQRLKEQSGQQVDLVAWYNWTTFDIIGDLVFGEGFDCLRNAEYHPWVRDIFGNLKAYAFLQACNQFPSITKLLHRCIPASIKAKRRLHHEFSKNRARRRMEVDSSRKDFMSFIIKYNDRNGGIKPNEIEANAGFLTIAGSETTATALSGVTYHLLKNPKVLSKLLAEIRSAFASEDEINFNTTESLKYLLACLEEGLRMYPASPAGLPRIVPRGGDTIAGHYVPEGTAVSVNHWSTYRSVRNFHLPDSYIPERWLDDDRFASDNRIALQPFSFGPRNCIGKNLAMAEIRVIIARMLWNFDLVLSEEYKGHDWTDQKVFIVWQKEALNVKVIAREFG